MCESARMTNENWFIMSDGKGAFNACFQMIRDGKVIGDGAALSGVSQAEAVAHVEMAKRNNAERDAKMAIANPLFDKTNWKMPTKRVQVRTINEARVIREALDFFCGGSEVHYVRGGKIEVGSLGYYNYVGA
jgi:coproporphyrinogen III oxidase